MRELADQFDVSACVETGTYQGATTAYLASMFPRRIVHSIEVNPSHFATASRRLRSQSNARLILGSSESLVANLLEKSALGPLPLFYLDAHWYDYWPLEDEVRQIASRSPKAIIWVDDFQVPRRDDFVYCMGGGGSPEFSGRKTIDTRVCNLALVGPLLNPRLHYDILFPSYGVKEAGSERMIGYVVIFQNLEPEFQSFVRSRFVRNHYRIFPTPPGPIGHANDWLRVFRETPAKP